MDLLSILNLEDTPTYREQAGSAAAGVRSPRGHLQTPVNHSALGFESDSEDWTPQLTPSGSPGSNEGCKSSLYSSSSGSSRNGVYGPQRQVYATGGRLAGRTQVSMATYGLGSPQGPYYSTPQPYNMHPSQPSTTLGSSGLSTPPNTPPSSSSTTPYTRRPQSLQDTSSLSSQTRRHRREASSPIIQSITSRRLPGVKEILNQSNYQPSRATPLASQAKIAYRDARDTRPTFTSINQRPPPSPEPDDDNEMRARRSRTDCWVLDCKLDSPDRRVVSHFFGRNKKETRAIPEDCWSSYCRQHYQRSRYQMKIHEFASVQMGLVRRTVENLETYDIVLYWTITIRKRMMDQIAQEDALTAAGKAHLIERPCQERALIPYCGENRSFADVYKLIDGVKAFSYRHDCEALEFEIVPQYHPGYLEKRSTQRRTSTKMPVRSKRPSSSSNSGKSTSGTNSVKVSGKA